MLHTVSKLFVLCFKRFMYFQFGHSCKYSNIFADNKNVTFRDYHAAKHHFTK